jgi:hypothetical protein
MSAHRAPTGEGLAEFEEHVRTADGRTTAYASPVWRLVSLALIATVLAGLYIARMDTSVRIIPQSMTGGSGGYVRLDHDPSPGLESALVTGDGQAYAAIARDPAISHPEVFRAGPSDAAYRWQRPLLGYLVYVASLGHPHWVPRAQAALVALGVGLAVAAIALLLIARSVPPMFALLVLASPGMLSSMVELTAEAWALAFLTIGLYAWHTSPRRRWVAAVALTLAVLAREGSLIAILALILVELIRSRDHATNTSRTSRFGPLLIPILTYAGWATLLRVRIGAWPFHVRGGLSIVPLRGLLDRIDNFAEPRQSIVWLAVGVILIAYAVARARRDPLTPSVIAYGIFALFVGSLVWDSWGDFGRALEPIYAYGYVIVLATVVEQRRHKIERDWRD